MIAFFNDYSGFTFFTDDDPTHGLVTYVPQSQSGDIAFVQSDGTAIMAVDDTTTLGQGQPRRSVRIQSKASYSSGLFIADIFAMPHGCATWPAFWMVGPNWPSGGEIDIIEGVNTNTQNQMTLHTSDGCTLDTSLSRRDEYSASGNGTVKRAAAFASSVLGTQCASSTSNNNGCAFLDPSDQSYGHGFNDIAGGVFATLLDDSGVKIWRFSRGSVPADITSQSPDPTTWGTPEAFWSSSTCSTQSHFSDMQLVFDITLCGDWAGAAFSGAGCGGSCTASVADPSNFSLAKWKVNYVAVYQ